MHKTMKQSLAEDTKEFNRIVAQWDKDGTWERARKNWGVSITSAKQESEENTTQIDVKALES